MPGPERAEEIGENMGEYEFNVHPPTQLMMGSVFRGRLEMKGRDGIKYHPGVVYSTENNGSWGWPILSIK